MISIVTQREKPRIIEKFIDIECINPYDGYIIKTEDSGYNFNDIIEIQNIITKEILSLKHDNRLIIKLEHYYWDIEKGVDNKERIRNE